MACLHVFVILVEHFIYRLKPMVIVIINLFFISLEFRSRSSKNWEWSRRIGFGSPGFCVSPGREYGIADVSAFNAYSGYDFQTSMAYSYKNNNKILCLQTGFQPCSQLIYGTGMFGMAYLKLSESFKIPYRDYFPLSTWIIILTLISMMLSFLFENSTTRFTRPNEGPFSTSRNAATMKKFNTAISVAIFGLMIISANSFVLMYGENCSSLYRRNGSGDNFCSELQACGLTLLSIVRPDGPAKHFSSITVFLACVLLFSVVITESGAVPIPSRRNAAIIPTEFDIYNLEDLEAFHAEVDRAVTNHTLRHVPMVLRSGNNTLIFRLGGSERPSLDNSFMQRITAIAKRHRMVRRWKCHTSPCPNHVQEAECSICLNVLFIVQPRDLSTVEHGRQGTTNASSGPAERGDGGSRDYAGISLWQDPQQTPSHVPDPSDSVAGTTMELYRSIPAMDEDTAAAHTPAVRYQYGDEVVGQQQQPVQQEEAEEAEEGSEQEVVVELPCAHSFHRSCIIQWATAHDSCPVCRAQLDPPDEQHADL